jgi:hypothetical protein
MTTNLAEDHGWVPGAPEPQERTPYYGNLQDFVTDFLAPHIRRRLGGQLTWCAQWWRHEEAISRLAALHAAWEDARYGDAVALSNWWLHHADPHLNVLLSKDAGPFAACKPDRHVHLEPLPCTPAPDGLFSSPAFSDPSAE